MSDIVERIERRIHDAPMPSEHLLDEAAEVIQRLRLELQELTSQPSYDSKYLHG